ncbi:MAG: hypothetical protein MUD08_15115 [Cytophagales bacterium]|jgi:hypothetical protein|nr:hypothetical protein [Cytophagales bacterium]
MRCLHGKGTFFAAAMCHFGKRMARPKSLIRAWSGKLKTKNEKCKIDFRLLGPESHFGSRRFRQKTANTPKEEPSLRGL